MSRIAAVAWLLLTSLGLPPSAVAADGAEIHLDAVRFAAIWPEDSAVVAEAAARRLRNGDDGWRADPEATAARFASSVLRWRDVTVSGPRPGHGRLGERSYVVRGAEPHQEVELGLTPTISDRWWSVTWLPVYDARLGQATLLDGRLRVRSFFQPPWAIAELEIGFGGRNRIIRSKPRSSRGDVMAFDAQLVHTPQTNGHILLVVRDARGEALGVTGDVLGPKESIPLRF